MFKFRFLLYLLGLAAAFFIGYSLKPFFSNAVTISSVDSDLFSYDRRFDIEGFTLFTNNDNTDFLFVRQIKQDSQTSYRWIVSEEKTDDGSILSNYYGPNSKVITKDPKVGPVSDSICTVVKKPQNDNYSIFCQLGKFPKGNLFIDRDNDGMWDTWHDQNSNIRYKYNKDELRWYSETLDE